MWRRIRFLDPDGQTVDYSFSTEAFEETGRLEMIPSSKDLWNATIDPRRGVPSQRSKSES
jgi:hypothetical protein